MVSVARSYRVFVHKHFSDNNDIDQIDFLSRQNGSECNDMQVISNSLK